MSFFLIINVKHLQAEGVLITAAEAVLDASGEHAFFVH